MSAVAVALRELMALGITGEALCLAVEAIDRAVQEERQAVLAEAVQVAVSSAPRAMTGAERMRRLRQNKAASCDESDEKRHAASQNVTAEIEPETTTPFSQEIIPPSPPKGGSSPTGETAGDKPRRKRELKSRFAPPEFAPSQSHHDKAVANGLSPGDFDRALSRFSNHEFRNVPTDWGRAFHKWLDGERPTRNERPHQNTRADNRAVWAEVLAESAAESPGPGQPLRLAG